MTPYNEEGV
ncbi:hypothetical protein RDI58_011220 [Solanum bulbocastanum]|uniref:Uncharacterized protein n=1 Tax=Solanum bulbocastanum TaxID=147425 RepID=A0AAN8TSD5_SOLBU